jgi:hypothetical protein
MIYCANGTCEYCMCNHLGDLVCVGEPNLSSTCDSLFNHNLICESYVERSEPQISELHPGRGRDGLFPGQLKDPNRRFLNG